MKNEGVPPCISKFTLGELCQNDKAKKRSDEVRCIDCALALPKRKIVNYHRLSICSQMCCLLKYEWENRFKSNQFRVETHKGTIFIKFSCSIQKVHFRNFCDCSTRILSNWITHHISRKCAILCRAMRNE